MNIIIAGNFLYPHGMACTKRIQHYIDYLKEYHAIIKILLLRHAEERVPKAQWERYNKNVFYKIIGNNIKFGFSSFITIPLYFWQGSKCLIKWRRKDTKNILFCYGAPGLDSLWFLLIAKIFGYKIILDIVEDFEQYDGSLHLLGRINLTISFLLERIVHKLTDAIVVISNHLQNKYITKTKNAIPIKLIPISATASELSKKKTFHSPIKMVYSGSFADKDDLDSLIKAFEIVYKSNKNISLLITGKGREDKVNAVKEKIEKHPAIKYLGYLKDNEFYEFLKDADILFMIRTDSNFANAGFPFKLGEYLATGNPVIASRVGDISLYLNNKKDALLVTPGNTNEIIQAIEYIIENPKRALKIGRAGRRKCIKHFNPELNGNIFLDLIDST